MIKECIFCKIVKKEIPAFIVHEDEQILSFLTIDPLNEGHALVIPKKHYENIFDVDEEILKKIISVAKTISQKMKKGLKAEGVNLLHASGTSAEQSVPHFHLHVVPRKTGDEVNMNSWWQTKTKKVSQEQLRKLAESIRTTPDISLGACGTNSSMSGVK